MKRIVALVLTMILVCAGLNGCDLDLGASDAIIGHWETVRYYTSDSMRRSMEDLDLYAEEIAMMDLGAVGYVDVFEIRDDKTYTITCDAEKSIAMVQQYFRDAFATFYQNRSELDDLYEDDLGSMTESQLQQFYADLYGQTDFDALIELFVYSITNEEYLLEGTEKGTYRVSRNRIWCTPEGEKEAQYIDFVVDGDILTLTYSDETVKYTRK